MGGGMKNILVGVIMVVIALILTPVVVDQVQAVLNIGLTDFPGAEAMVSLIPLVWIVGVLFLAGFLAFKGIAGGKKSKGF